LKVELTQTFKAIEVVEREVQTGTPIAKLLEDNEATFRRTWSEANQSETLESFYFEELTPPFTSFRNKPTKSGLLLRRLSSAPFLQLIPKNNPKSLWQNPCYSRLRSLALSLRFTPRARAPKPPVIITGPTIRRAPYQERTVLLPRLRKNYPERVLLLPQRPKPS
jgi:hypothetical protein